MDVPPVQPARILVLARPAIGRRLEVVLRSAGHEVYRTPDPAAAERLATKLHVEVVVVALDLPWGDALAAAEHLRDGERPVPVLLLGNETPRDGFPRLPVGADAEDVRTAVSDLSANWDTKSDIVKRNRHVLSLNGCSNSDL
jgi:CheY-like chemotaxis protein